MIYFHLVKNEQEFFPCEAPIHNAECLGIGNTVDHFTPECIGKLWGWSKEEIKAPKNLQHLSRPCHDDKDRTTEARLSLLRRQLRKVYVSLNDYLEVYDPNFHLEREQPVEPKKKKKREKKPKYSGRRGGSSGYSGR